MSEDNYSEVDAETAPGLARREFLKRASAASAAALIAGCGDGPNQTSTPHDASDGTNAADSAGDSASGDVADVAPETDGPPPDAGLTPALKPLRGDGSHPFHYIDTVVIVQMENRTFDHQFSALVNIEGRTDITAAPAGWSNPDLNGNAVIARELKAEYVIDPDPHHGHSASLEQWANGANDGFVRNWQPSLGAQFADRLDWVMGYHTRDQLQASYALADNFTLYDHWHAALLGPTWPNRFFSHAASSGGHTTNSGGASVPTPYPEILAAGNTINIYHENTVYFPLLLNEFPHDDVPRFGPGVDSNEGGLIKFFEHAEAGKLPNISIVEPDFSTADDHPPADVRLGQAFISSIYDALANSPQWDRCLMLVFYDEHGGFADHVPPPDSAGDTLAGVDPAKNFSKLGFRVPGMAIGPLVRRGKVVSETVEHSSLPKLLRDIFTPDKPYVNERAKLAGDLGLSLDLELIVDANRPLPPTLPQLTLPLDRMRFAERQPFGQKELAQAALKLRGLRPLSQDRLRRKNDIWLSHLDRRRLVSVR